MHTKISPLGNVVVAVLAVLVVKPLLGGVSLAQQFGPAVAPQEGIILLRNGETLCGTVTRMGDRYSVGVNGGEVSVRVADVEMVCRSLDEAYQQKRLRIPLDNVAERLELAQWCQRQGMLGAAAQELSEAMAADPNHPMISVVERRLRLAVQQSQQGPQSTAKNDPAPSANELDRIVRGMPPGTVEAFTQTIQPMLMNNCTASACHGPGADQGLSLLRAPTGRPPSRRLTQRNLLATLQWINRSDPASSPLLAAPTRAHGTAKAPIFTDHQVSQYQELVDWVYRVCQVPSPVTPISRHREPAKRPSHVAPASHDEPLNTEMRAPFPGLLPSANPNRSAPNRAAGGGPGVRPGNPGQLPASANVKRAQQIPSSVPTDALDPEAFNRQFAPPPRPVTSDPPPERR